MARHYTVIALTCLLAVSLTVAPISAQTGEYDITVDDSIDTPDRTLTLDGQSYTVTAVKQADPGDSISVTVNAPSGNFVEVYIYNAERQIVDSKEIEADESRPATVSFDLSSYSTGTYTFALSYDGETKSVHPLIVRSYDVSTTAPDEATADAEITLSATLSQLRPGKKSGVEFVIANDENTLRVDASESNGSYEATVDLSSLDTGDYSTYATVRGTKQVAGNKSRLGLSQPETLSIEEASDDNGGGGGGGGGGVGGTVDMSTATPNPDPQENSTVTPGSQETVTQSATSTSTPSPDSSTATQQATDERTEMATTVSSATTESSAITPQSMTTTPDTTTAESGPGFGWLVAAIALIITGMALLVQRHYTN